MRLRQLDQPTPFLRIAAALGLSFGVLWLSYDWARAQLTHAAGIPFHKTPVTYLAWVVVELTMYLYLAGFLQGILLAGVFVIGLTMALSRGLRWFLRFLHNAVGFWSILLVTGAMGNLVWVLAARDRMYDAPDPTVEWYPSFHLPHASTTTSGAPFAASFSAQPRTFTSSHFGPPFRSWCGS